MGRCIVPEADEILDKEYPVLDKGFVRLVDYMGGDQRIVQAARVSYGEGTKTVRQDAGLIDYLLRNEHTSPFEQVVFTFHAKMPVFVARQWVRHRTARLNEISGRYSVMPDEFYVPALEDVAEQSSDNKQGRKNEPMEQNRGEAVRKAVEEVHRRAYAGYQRLLDDGTARELARIVLPLSLYTEWYWQIDLHNLFRFLRLRLDPHAQKEIRSYAAVIRNIAAKVCPLAFESFDRHLWGGAHFSDDEMAALKRLINGENHGLEGKDAERFEMKLSEGRQT
jgi:thymidylate synthase (FAD)